MTGLSSMVQEMFHLLIHVFCQPDVGGSLVVRSFAILFVFFLSNGAVLFVHMECDLTV